LGENATVSFAALLDDQAGGLLSDRMVPEVLSEEVAMEHVNVMTIGEEESSVFDIDAALGVDARVATITRLSKS